MMQLLVTSITNEESIKILPVPRLGNYQCNPGSRNRSSSVDGGEAATLVSLIHENAARRSGRVQRHNERVNGSSGIFQAV
jgi:hypothetical protein